LDEALRAAPRQGGASLVSDDLLAGLGWSPEDGRRRLRALGFAPAARPKAGEPTPWRRRGAAPGALEPPARTADPASPFAALAALKPAATAPAPRPAAKRHTARRRRPRSKAAAS
ncbi:MAG TPA: phosphonate-binding protein, partial [Phenylobacterium sp.]|nr:phosphonate-binding protein [Phenylobacterium sp.]